jgi:hypothetical protein
MIPQQPPQAATQAVTPGAPPQAAPPAAGQPPLKRPLIKSSSQEDVSQEVAILEQNVEEFFFGKGAEDRMRRIAQEMSDNANNLPKYIGERSADLMQELIRNATISGHAVDKQAILMTMKNIVENLFEIAANIGAWTPKDENEMQTLQVQALLVGLREFFMNAPEGYSLSQQELKQFLMEANQTSTAVQGAAEGMAAPAAGV